MYVWKFTDIGEGIHEGKIAELKFKQGDKINDGDTLFTVETDKMNAEMPAPATGTIVKLNISVGQTIHVGDVICEIDDGATDAPAAQSAQAAQSAPAGSETTTAKPVEDQPQAEAPKTEAVEEGGASVVGEVKVSNNLLPSFFRTGAAPKKKAISSGTTIEVNEEEPEKIIGDFDYDLVVIGGGPGGYSAAETAARYGLKTAVIEKEKLGGVCLNVGCIPTKTLLKSAKVHDYVQHLADFGIEANENIKINWEVMQNRRQKVVNTLVGGVSMKMKKYGITVINETAVFINKHTIKAGGKKITSKYFIIATGSSPRVLPTPGFESAIKSGDMISSKGALSLSKVPKTLTIIGGGVIGIEFAVIYAQLGTKVTILQNIDRILELLDNDVIQEMTKIIQSKKIDIIFNAQIQKMSGKTIHYTVDGKEQKVTSEKTLLSVGRVPNIDIVKPLKGLKMTERGAIEINEYCRTSISNIYAIGDVVGKSMLAHTAYKHSWIAVSHIANKKRTINYDRIPACIYTFPEVAAIGLTQQEAEKRGERYFVVKLPMTMAGKSFADGDTRGFIKLLVGKEIGNIIGCHIVGGTATDMIAEIATVMELEGTVFELSDSIHPHPTISEIIFEAAREAVFILEK